MSYQLRILVTAMFFVCILGRRLSGAQWFSLVVLTCGVSVVQLEGSSPGDRPPAHHNRLLGLLAVLCMCGTSGFGSVYFEKVLKGSSTSIWVQNIRLSLIGEEGVGDVPQRR